MNKATYVKEIEVTDPDTQGTVHLSVYKHQNGGMFALDSSFVEQLPPLDEEDDIRCKVMDPLSDPAEPDYVILEE
jgi:hypothetical protein